MSVGSQTTPGLTPNMNEIDLEEQYGIEIEIERYKFNNLDTQVRIRNDVTIHYAGYFIKSGKEARKILKSCTDDKFTDNSPLTSPTSSPTKSTQPARSPPRKYRMRPKNSDTDTDPVPLWRTDSVISLLEKEHHLNHFCSTWPQHGDKVLPGPITFPLGDERYPLAPSLVLAIKQMRIGEIRLVYVPPAEVYGLDMSPVKRRLPPKEPQAVSEEMPVDTGERELPGEEEQTRVKKGKTDPYYSSSSDDDFDPDEEITEPWCDAPGTKGDRSTFFRPLTEQEQQQQQQQQQQQEREVHRGLTGLLYAVQLLDFGESCPDGEIIHVKQPLETDKKSDKPEAGNVDT